MYVVPLLDNSAEAYLPDEIALLQYHSEALYHTFYATPIGQYYQNLHAKFFNMSVSHSLVPQDKIAKFSFNQAFCLPSCNFTWTDYFAASTVFYYDEVDLHKLQTTMQGFLDAQPAAVALVVGIYPNYCKVVSFFASDKDLSAVAPTIEQQLEPFGTFVGPAVQPARNVVPPLDLAFGTTVNVTIGPCTIAWNATTD